MDVRQPEKEFDEDRHYDPMIYDVMCELTNQVAGRYVAWSRTASTPIERQHWQEELFKVQADRWAVDPDSKRAVEARIKELRELFASLPREAPPLP